MDNINNYEIDDSEQFEVFDDNSETPDDDGYWDFG